MGVWAVKVSLRQESETKSKVWRPYTKAIKLIYIEYQLAKRKVGNTPPTHTHAFACTHTHTHLPPQWIQSRQLSAGMTGGLSRFYWQLTLSITNTKHIALGRDLRWEWDIEFHVLHKIWLVQEVPCYMMTLKSYGIQWKKTLLCTVFSNVLLNFLSALAQFLPWKYILSSVVSHLACYYLYDCSVPYPGVL